MAKKTTYSVNPKHSGNTVGVKAPPYPRKGGGVFVLDDTLTQKDMEYLHTVCGLKEHITCTTKAEDAE